jgi:hypothetical protein
MEDLTGSGTAPRGPDGRPDRASARPAPAAPIRDLRWLRQRVLERMDALEALARRIEASSGAAAETAALERTLQQKLAEVDEARRQLRAEAERQAQEWSASLAQLEADRRLLAEAWERVERQRIEGFNPYEGRPHAQWRGSPQGAPARSAAADPDPNNPVARAILREFQTLSRDVRSNAEARRESP